MSTTMYVIIGWSGVAAIATVCFALGGALGYRKGVAEVLNSDTITELRYRAIFGIPTVNDLTDSQTFEVNHRPSHEWTGV